MNKLLFLLIGVFINLNQIVADDQIIQHESDPYWQQVLTLISSPPEELIQDVFESSSPIRHMTIPMDFNPELESQNFDDFWSNEAIPWQIELYENLKMSVEKYNNIDAMFKLSQILLNGIYNIPWNGTLAYHYLHQFNENTHFSNATALFQLSVMYSTGLFGEIPKDDTLALILMQKSATLDYLPAKQALAFDYFNGITLSRDCNIALILYRELAEELHDSYTPEQWNLRLPYVESYNLRISDFHDGLLGKGLSTTPLSITRVPSTRPDITSSLLTQMNGGQIILQFGIGENSGREFASDNDDDTSDDRLVDLFYTAFDYYKGTYDMKRDCVGARKILLSTYQMFSQDVPYMDNLQKYFYGKCLDLLGHLYFTGEGSEDGKPDIKSAEKYLRLSLDIIEKSSTLKSRANVDLGLIQQYIYENTTNAIKHYKKIIHSRTSDGTADYQLAMLQRADSKLKIGTEYELFQGAYVRQHPQGTYEFAKLVELGINDHYSCDDSVRLYKQFVELNENILAPEFKKAYEQLVKGNTQSALWNYAILAEQGFESAQVSAAYLLYQHNYLLEEPPITTEERKKLAIHYYSKSFKQSNADSGVIAGNIYFGMGEYTKAISMYQSASIRYSAQAAWNLGYMHEYGLGVERDFHLAKRYYDQAVEINPKLYLGVKLSVLKLRFKAIIYWLLNETWKYQVDKDNETDIGLPWYKKIFKSFQLASKENSWVYDEAALQEQRQNLEQQQHQQAHAQQQQQQHHQNDGERGITDDLMDALDAYGIQFEDLITIGFVLVILVSSLILRTLAMRRGWNVRINGMPMQNNGNGANQNPGNFDIQIFAI